MSIPKIDFAGDTVPVFDATTGTELRAHVFVAVLGASNYTCAVRAGIGRCLPPAKAGSQR